MGSSSSKKKATINGVVKKKKKESIKKKDVNKAMKSCDVMISYSHNNRNMMVRVKECLERNGLKVWVDVTGLEAGTDFLNKIGQAIIDSKVFICLLSEDSIDSKYCQDEVALAYVSDKAIYPLLMSEPSHLFSKMSTGMKLQLSGFEWNVFKEENQFESNMMKVSEKIRTHIDTIIANADQNQTGIKDAGRSTVNTHIDKFQSRISELVGNIYDETIEELEFWNKYYSDRSNIPWEKFIIDTENEYKNKLTSLFSKSDIDWLFIIMRREICNEEGYVTLENYTNFCTINNVRKSFWPRIVEQAVESYTMKEVFNMDSSVRVEAIENLGKYRSPAVIDALLDLMKDPDTNVITVAAISLARIEISRPDIIKALMQCLQSPDRLVRESACLALGHLKVEKAVSRLVALWRNDFISSVREAAQISLKQIGGTEADKAIQMTNILGKEIRSLSNE